MALREYPGPDSNVNEGDSHGQVSFRIRPHLPLLPGTVIENTANIYFDYNPPVITEPSVLTAEFSTSVDMANGPTDHLVTIQPVPAKEATDIISNGPAISTVRMLAMDGRTMMMRSLDAPVQCICCWTAWRMACTSSSPT